MANKPSINIHGENVKIWRKDYETKSGETFHTYSIQSSTKNEDGTYGKAYTRVMFTKASDAPKNIKNGAVCDFDGFLSATKPYKTKDGTTVTDPLIVIMKATFEDDNADGFAQAEVDIPF